MGTTYKNLAGMRFGKLMAIRRVPNQYKCHSLPKGKVTWLCHCDCGNDAMLSGQDMQRLKVISCGCMQHLRGIANPRFLGRGELSGATWCQIKAAADKRKLIFNVSIDEAWALFLGQGRKCALSDLALDFGSDDRRRTASLDRIDSDKGYTVDNVQWVHKDINMAKQSKSDEEFIHLCKAVANKWQNN